jgi:hypothetical protein
MDINLVSQELRAFRPSARIVMHELRTICARLAERAPMRCPSRIDALTLCEVQKQVWAQFHEEAFRYFGGSTQYVVLENLREGVITPDLYEPEINRLYAAMLEHYGVVADPARVRDPNRKGTVEHAIKHTQDTALKCRRFESIEAQNEFLMHWEENWAARRIHGNARRQVQAMFQEEKPHLQALPLTGFRYFKEVVRTVNDDTTVSIGRRDLQIQTMSGRMLPPLVANFCAYVQVEKASLSRPEKRKST